MTNSTIAGNSGSAGVDAGAGPARIVLTNSIVAGNDSIDCQGTGVISGGGKVIGQTDSNCPNVVNSQFDIVGTPASPVDPLLGSLAANGGPTQTVALLSGSPAIGHASAVVCHFPPVGVIDQRGVKRLTTSCDSGADERPGVGEDPQRALTGLRRYCSAALPRSAGPSPDPT